MSIPDHQRERFDELLEIELHLLPERFAAVIEEIPVVVDDEPDRPLLQSLALEYEVDSIEPDELCGLHTGIALTERTMDMPTRGPQDIRLFRLGIFALAGGYDVTDDALSEEIRVTLLHELGHHFGLDEDELEELGYA
ncbi:MAG: metallopeptidase family protein [Planctomycetota bacterium]